MQAVQHTGCRQIMKVMIPRKYRSAIYKLLIIVPVLWLTVVLIAHNNGAGSGDSSNDLISQKLRQQLNVEDAGPSAVRAGPPAAQEPANAAATSKPKSR